jgi:uncharacterized protein YoxC
MIQIDNLHFTFNFSTTAQEQIMARLDALATSLTEVTAQVAKIGTETTTLLVRIDELLAAIAAGGQTTPEVDAALSALRDQVAIVDALVPDAAP